MTFHSTSTRLLSKFTYSTNTITNIISKPLHTMMRNAAVNLPRSCLLAKRLVPCPKSWLPEEGICLTCELPAAESAAAPDRPRKRVWFPEDSSGEPHPSNPDDGCGGAKYKLTMVAPIYATSDGKPPSQDLSNVLENKEARAAHRAERHCTNHNETLGIYRDAAEQLRASLYVPSDSRKKEIWTQFETAFSKLAEPDWSTAGLLWRTLYKGAERPEEIQLENYEYISRAVQELVTTQMWNKANGSSFDDERWETPSVPLRQANYTSDDDDY